MEWLKEINFSVSPFEIPENKRRNFLGEVKKGIIETLHQRRRSESAIDCRKKREKRQKITKKKLKNWRVTKIIQIPSNHDKKWQGS